MKIHFVKCICLAGALGLGLFAQPARGETEVEALQRQFQELKQNFERVTTEQRQVIERLQQRVEKLQAQSASNAQLQVVAVTPAEPATTTGTAPIVKSWSPTDPIRVGKGSAYADIGLVATFAAGGSTADDIEDGTQLGGHDPNQNGFTIQGVELNLQGAIDPYFRGNANILFSVDSGGESFVELEEAWLETISLPWNLQIRAGQYLTEFGRINTQHPHSWAFVDSPLVNARFLGGDGLRNPGARISWLVPTPFYSELFFGVQNSQGETAHSFRSDHEDEPFFGRIDGAGSVEHFSDLLFSARYATSFDLTDNQTLLAGASAAFGPNSSGDNADTQIYGVDVYWKWKSPNAHAGFPFVTWQTEAMVRRYEAAASTTADLDGDDVSDFVPHETLTDWGFYSQLLWGFKKGWVAGFRGDYITRCGRADYEQIYGDDPERLGRWRLSPNLTWYPSEFSKIRLQYNYDDRDEIGCDHSVWLQFEFLLGAHAAHKF